MFMLECGPATSCQQFTNIENRAIFLHVKKNTLAIVISLINMNKYVKTVLFLF